MGGAFGYRYLTSAEFESLAIDFGLGKPYIVSLAGTGSMYPTFPKGTGKTIQELSQETVARIAMYGYPSGISLFKQRYFPYTLQRGDIVSFENENTKKITTEQSGTDHPFMKRVFGLPGDVIELRDGIAYRNGVAQQEPYTAQARSTFGGEFLNDCKKLTVPPGRLFVMGDNRKSSLDSRSTLGLVSYTEIDSVIPWDKQKGALTEHWRDTTRDFEESEKIHLDKPRLLEKINALRADSKFKPLAFNQKLEKAAGRRGEVMLKTDDISHEATRSGYTMAKAMKEVGYSNITWSEFPLLGYYDNDEYFEALLEYPKLKKIFVDEDFQDIGIAEISIDVNGCPQHIIVTQFGGYIPPDYDPTTITSWKSALESLRKVYPGWQRLTESGVFYEKHTSDVDRLLYLMDLRIKNISGIVIRMEANQWLTDDQQQYISKDKEYGSEQEQLSEKINNF